MQTSSIMKINLVRPTQSPSRNSKEKQKSRRRYYIDFNSRLIIPPRKLSFKPTQSPYCQNSISNSQTSISNSNRNSGYSLSQHTSIANTQNIKQKLQKILQKQYKYNSPHIPHLTSAEQSLTLQEIQRNSKIGSHHQNKSKSLFFKSNLKMNKNKKDLQDLSKRSMLQFQHTKRDTQYESINFHSPSPNNNKIKDHIFIVKQMKLQTNKISPMTTQHKRKYDNQNNDFPNTKFISQHDIFPSFNVFKSSLVCNNKKEEKGCKVLTIFKKYDEEWYKREKGKLQDTCNEEQQTKIQSQLTKNKIVKPKLSLRGKKNQQYFQPWKPAPVDTYLDINDEDANF